mmetsp:Transcript_12025/g.32981  ORF Transcript_12025/g.32981 Transcript_12025/m.32981 type:complete len:222 (-) Transcript_12025:267-932(-)
MRKLLSQRASHKRTRGAATVQSKAQGVKKAAAVARLWHCAATPQEELAATAAHLQRVLAAIIHPSILVVIAWLPEVWASLCGVRPITPVALSRRGGRGFCAARPGAARARARGTRAPKCWRRLWLFRRALATLSCTSSWGAVAAGLLGQPVVARALHAPRELECRLDVVRRQAEDHNRARWPSISLVGQEPLLVHEGSRAAAQVHDEAMPLLVAQHGGVPP